MLAFAIFSNFEKMGWQSGYVSICYVLEQKLICERKNIYGNNNFFAAVLFQPHFRLIQIVFIYNFFIIFLLVVEQLWGMYATTDLILQFIQCKTGSGLMCSSESDHFVQPPQLIVIYILSYRVLTQCSRSLMYFELQLAPHVQGSINGFKKRAFELKYCDQDIS